MESLRDKFEKSGCKTTKTVEGCHYCSTVYLSGILLSDFFFHQEQVRTQHRYFNRCRFGLQKNPIRWCPDFFDVISSFQRNKGGVANMQVLEKK